MARLAASGRRLLQAMEAEDPVQEAILLWRSGWLRRHAPELARLEGCAQSNPHHVWDAWCHTLAALAHAPRDPTLRLAALYHDVGKPATRRWDAARSRHTFHGHDTEGERIWRRAARRHGFSPQRTRRVARLIRHHLMPARHDDKWGPRALRRLRRALGGPWALADLVAVAQADACGHAPASAARSHAAAAALASRLGVVRWLPPLSGQPRPPDLEDAPPDAPAPEGAAGAPRRRDGLGVPAARRASGASAARRGASGRTAGRRSQRGGRGARRPDPPEAGIRPAASGAADASRPRKPRRR